MKQIKNETLKDQTKYIIKKNFKTSINELFFFLVKMKILFPSSKIKKKQNINKLNEIVVYVSLYT